MGVTFANLPCLDPLPILEELARKALPTDWIGKPNTFRSPSGRESGVGWILLTRGQLNTLNLNNPASLTFADSFGNSTTLAAVYVVRCTCVSPSSPSDPAAPYLVELADIRQLLRWTLTDTAYNVRLWPGAQLGSDSVTFTNLNSGALWTWDQMVEDLWESIPSLGDYPSLPYSPDGTPEDWQFWCMSSWDALNDVFDRLGCVLTYDNIANTFGIVQLGASDTVNATAVKNYGSDLYWDNQPADPVVCRIPQYLVIRYRVGPPPSPGNDPYYYDLVDLGVAGSQPNTSVIIDDDLIMLTDVYGNQETDTSSRSAERAAAWLLERQRNRSHQVYRRDISDAGFRPGSLVDASIHGDRGRGYLTETVRTDDVLASRWDEGRSDGAGNSAGERDNFPDYPFTLRIQSYPRFGGDTFAASGFGSYPPLSGPPYYLCPVFTLTLHSGVNMSDTISYTNGLGFCEPTPGEAFLWIPRSCDTPIYNQPAGVFTGGILPVGGYFTVGGLPIQMSDQQGGFTGSSSFTGGPQGLGFNSDSTNYPAGTAGFSVAGINDDSTTFANPVGYVITICCGGFVGGTDNGYGISLNFAVWEQGGLCALNKGEFGGDVSFAIFSSSLGLCRGFTGLDNGKLFVGGLRVVAP